MGGVWKAFAIGAIMAASTPALAFEPYGVWLREKSGTQFDFYNCAGKLCARILSVVKPEDQPVVGTVILRNAVRDEEGAWRGDIFNTENGKIYDGAVTLESADELTLEGCLMRYLCKSETWRRAPDQSKASTPGGKLALPAPLAGWAWSVHTRTQ